MRTFRKWRLYKKQLIARAAAMNDELGPGANLIKNPTIGHKNANKDQSDTHPTAQ